MKKGLTVATSIGKENYIEEAPKLALYTSAKNELCSLRIFRATAQKNSGPK